MDIRLTKLLALGLMTLGIAVSGGWVGVKGYSESDSSRGNVQEGTFTLNRNPEKPELYTLVVSDNDEQTISGSFSVDQLQVLRAIMTEAEKFAFSGEAAGTKEPITTRFADKQQTAFIVDVEKLGLQSTLFITLETEIGRMTFTAGRVIRSTRRAGGAFFDLLSRLESILPKAPARPSQ